MFVALPPAAPAPTPAAVRADHAFVADCLAQRRRDAVSEPLADLSAQNLVGRLDSSPSTEPTTDAGVF